MFKFRDNLNRVRSVSKQLLSNFERAIEKSVRNLEKEDEKVEEAVKVEEKQQEEVKVEEPVVKPKRTRTKKQAESEVEHA